MTGQFLTERPAGPPSLTSYHHQRRPPTRPFDTSLLGHPSLVLGELDATAASHVDHLLLAAGVFDALAAHVVYVARQRGWPALTDDPGRLRRVDPNVQLDLL
ncbi:MAG: hypothetical protein ACRD0H_25660 [Actinomycetes bacterium]